MDPQLLQKTLLLAKKGPRFAFATVIESTIKGTPQKAGAKMVVFEDGAQIGTIGGGRNEKAAERECLKAIKSGKAHVVTYNFFGGKDQSVCGGQIKVFIEPYRAPKHLIVCGCGHIALPLSAVAKMLDFKVTVIDDRKSFANKKRFAHVDRVLCGDFVKSLKKLTLDSDTFIMIVTRGNEHDFQCLKTVISSDAGYIGVISSQAKRVKFLNRLKKMNIPENRLKTIDIPAGIDIGAQSPQEIAVSIAAKLVAVSEKQRLGSDKFKSKSKTA